MPACLLPVMAGYMAGDSRVHDPRVLNDFWSSSESVEGRL